MTLTIGPGITFLLGRNNVGKSSLLRFFAELRPVFEQSVDMRRKTEFVITSAVRFDALANQRDGADVIRIAVEYDSSIWAYDIREQRVAPQSGPQLAVNFVPVNYNNDNEVAARVGKILADAMYFGPLRSPAYNAAIPVVSPAAVGSNFVSQWSEWCAGDTLKHRLAARDLEEDIRHLFGFTRFSMALNHNRTELMVNYDEGSFKLTELGEGLAHFIVVLGNAVMRSPSIILIDEPENGLHPKLQATFVHALAARCTHGTLASSHSMGLARSVADRVLFCTRGADGCLIVGEHAKLQPLHVVQELLEMSYSQHIESSEQNLLLVEGRTDVKAYREVLRHYDIDQRFIIIPLGGGEFLQRSAARYKDELSELNRVGAKSVSVVLDSDRSSPTDPVRDRTQALADVCRELGFHVHILHRRALENYISRAASGQGIGTEPALGEFGQFGNGTGWNKNQNWRKIAAMAKSDIDPTDLGGFVRETLVPLAGIN